MRGNVVKIIRDALKNNPNVTLYKEPDTRETIKGTYFFKVIKTTLHQLWSDCCVISLELEVNINNKTYIVSDYISDVEQFHDFLNSVNLSFKENINNVQEKCLTNKIGECYLEFKLPIADSVCSLSIDHIFYKTYRTIKEEIAI